MLLDRVRNIEGAGELTSLRVEGGRKRCYRCWRG